MDKIKLERDLNFYKDGITLTRGKKGETHDIPDNLLPTIKALNSPIAKTAKGNAPENKGKGV